MHQEAGHVGTTAFVNHASVRLELFYFLGLDYQHDPAVRRSAAERQDAPHGAPLLGAGIGGTKLAELARLDAPGNSYHAGIGFEVHVAAT